MRDVDRLFPLASWSSDDGITFDEWFYRYCRNVLESELIAKADAMVAAGKSADEIRDDLLSLARTRIDHFNEMRARVDRCVREPNAPSVVLQ